MRIETLIEDMEQKGIHLWADGEKLKFKAPSGVVDNEIRIQLKENKQLIMSYLKKKNAPVHDETSRYEAFELTDIQTSYLLGSSDVYNYGQVGCKVFAELDTPILKISKLTEAWSTVIMRHDMLRAEIFSDGKQKVQKEVEIPAIRVIDASGDEDILVEQKLCLLEKEKLQHKFCAGEWPFYDLVLVHRRDRDILCLTVDMLIADFSSMKIIVNELEDAYYGRPLCDISLTYKDILTWRKNNLSEKKYEVARRYWINRIDFFPEAPELPIRKNSAENNGEFEFEQYSFKLPPDMFKKLTEIAKNHEITLSNLFLTVYAKIIGLWSRQQDFVLNITMSDRPDVHVDIAKVIGDFTIVNLLEVHNGGRMPFFTQAEKIQNQLFTDLTYKQFTGIEMMREMNRREEKTRFFPIVYTSTLGSTKEDEKRRFRLVHKITQTPQVFLDCQVFSMEDTVMINWDVRKNIFPDGMINDAFAMFCKMIRRLAEDKYDVDMYVEMGLPPRMVKKRAEMNNTKGTIPTGLLQDRVMKNILNYPNRVAVITSEKEYSYEELGRYAASVSHALRINGVIKDNLIAVNLEKGIWQIATVLGILWTGCAYLPLDIEQPDERKREIMSSSSTGFCVTADYLKMDDVCIINIADIQIAEKLMYEEVRAEEDSLAYVIYTSGSTGKPKGVAISHRSALNTIIDMNERYGITSKDRILAVANLAFDLSVYDIFGILSAGGAMVLPDQKEMKNPHHWGKMICKYHVTIWNSVPAQMQMLVFYVRGENEKMHSTLRTVFLSGDWIPVTLPEEVKSVFPGCRVISLGGATEASIWSIHYDIESEMKFQNSVPYGFPLKNQYFRILNENMDDCPDMVTGELMIGGLGLAQGYLNDYDQTSQSFIVHPANGERLYRTGDIGRYIGECGIEFQGRKDTQVKINGHRIELSEIESDLRKEKDIEDCAVVTFESSIVAFLRPETKYETGRVISKQEIERVVKNEGFQALYRIDATLFNEWSRVADETAVLDMLHCLRSQGIFVENRGYSLEEIYELLHIHPAFKNLIVKWLETLCDEKLIKKDAKGGIYREVCKDVTQNSAQKAWEKWNEIEEKLHYSKKLMHYFGQMRENLALMLNGTLDPLDLYFPKGDPTNALAAYHDNMISKVMNDIMGSALVAILKERLQQVSNRRLNILEIGAGIGGASRDLIEIIKDYNVEYIFTDISQFYLNEAKKTFIDYNFVKYKLLDMNRSFLAQGIKKESIDIVIFSQVLHNAEDIEAVLNHVRDVLTEWGYIIIADTTAERKSLLTSVAFNAGGKDTFLSVLEYKRIFENEHIDLITTFPEEDSVISEAKQNIFIGTYVPDRKKLNLDEVRKSVASNLPLYMVPDKFVVVRDLPLNRNGKVDRSGLIDLLQQEKISYEVGGGEYPTDELEMAIEKIWAKALNRGRLFRDENFYQAGGDSLLIAQVVAEMKEKLMEAQTWEWDSLMREIIETPTIRGITEKLKNSINSSVEQKEKENNIVIFSEGNGKRKVKVLFHDGTGTIYPYQNLIPYLKEISDIDETIIGFANSDIDEYERLTVEGVIHGLGVKYGKILCELEFEKYELIGFCFGGMVAVEASKYLMQEGKNVLPVRTIDTPYCDRRITSGLLMERTFGMSIGIDVRKYGYYSNEELLLQALDELLKTKEVITDIELCHLDGRYSDLGKSFQKMIQKKQKNRLADLYEDYINRSSTNAGMSWERFETTFRINYICFEAMGRYDELFMGDVIDMYCKSEDINFFPMLGNKGGTFWPERVMGGIKEIPIDGNHNTCLREPLVGKVAAIINALPQN